MMLHCWIAVVYLILVELFKKKIIEKGEPWLIASSLGCCSVFLCFVFIIGGVVLYRKFYKRRGVNVAPSRNSIVGRGRAASNLGGRGNMNQEPVIASRANLIDHEVKAASSPNTFEEIDLNSEYETIFPLPGRLIKPSTYPRPAKKPPRKPRRHEVLGSNAALSPAAGEIKDGSGYLEVTESGGATYLTIIDGTVPAVPARQDSVSASDMSEAGDGYEMDALNHQGDPVYLPMQQNQADPLYLSMQGDASQAVYISMKKNDVEDDYTYMKNIEGFANKQEEGVEYVNMQREGIGETEFKATQHNTAARGQLASSSFNAARAVIAESFKRRSRSGSTEGDYSVMRNTGRAHSDAYYINIKPDGRISWASDDDGYLRARYPSESDGGLPSPMAIANPDSRTHENASKPWKF